MLWWDVNQIKNGVPTGLKDRGQRCLFFVLADEIPKIVGSIDGAQTAANEARNRAIESKGIMESYIGATLKSLKMLASRSFNARTNSKTILVQRQEPGQTD